MSEEKSKAVFCDLMGVSASQLERLFQQGLPHHKRGKRVYVAWPEGRHWYHAYLTDKGKRQAAPENVNEARRRIVLAEAEQAEIELARTRGDLMTVSEFERLISDAYARVRARLLNLPPRLAGVVVGAATKPEAQARIEPLVLEVLAELHGANDVPDPESEPDDVAGDRAA